MAHTIKSTSPTLGTGTKRRCPNIFPISIHVGGYITFSHEDITASKGWTWCIWPSLETSMAHAPRYVPRRKGKGHHTESVGLVGWAIPPLNGDTTAWKGWTCWICPSLGTCTPIAHATMYILGARWQGHHSSSVGLGKRHIPPLHGDTTAWKRWTC